MNQLRLTVLLLVWILLNGSTLTQELSSALADEVSTVEDSAERVDQLFRESWTTEGVTAADPADDSEFLRRIYLDLAGRIPAVSELRDFLADTTPEKRRAVVEGLLDSPSFVRNLTTVFRNALIPQASSQPEFRSLVPGFEAWLWHHFAENRPYDQIVREIISADLNIANAAALSATTTPDAFFAVRELKPENLAAGTARAFLGVRLDCAQCHNHPFDRWTQQQFWNMAAFYSGFSRPSSDEDNPAMMLSSPEDRKARSIAMPGTGEVVPAIFLSGQAPDWNVDAVSTRTRLADWIVDRQNPYFAKMAVNRLWAQFFGRGLVNPVDDFSENNPASHPAVLDLLAEDFVAHDFNLQHTIRVIAATQTYQLSSRQSHASQADAAQFARAALRGLTPEQFFDSLAEAVGYYQPYRSDNPFVVDTDSPRARFLDLFRDSAESAQDRETTILQALAMMNGDFIENATSLEESQTLRAIVEFPQMSDDQKIETLFLSALTRPPTAQELTRMKEHLVSAETAGTRNSAFSDIFWALLNSSEFLLNH